MKGKIEEEIIKINNLYEKVNCDLTNSFQIKHEKLNQEEKGIREELQNKVTKSKEILELFLSESNKVLVQFKWQVYYYISFSQKIHFN